MEKSRKVFPPMPGKKIAIGGLVAGKYKLLRMIGKGGNGQVWLADHLQLDTKVVLKFTLNERQQDQSEQADESFYEKEVRALAKFSNGHPNIANILDAGIHLGFPYMVIQFLGGGSLDRYIAGSLRATGQVAAASLQQTLSWLSQIAGALDYIHANQLIHQDVKPANILLDQSYSAYLADFGIAGQLQLGSTTNQKIYGSLAYIAPEIFDGLSPSPLSDQYSLGVTLYEYACGHKPFSGNSREQIVEEQKQPILEIALRQGFALEMAQAFDRVLARDPSNRFSSCQEFANVAISKIQSQSTIPTVSVSGATVPEIPLVPVRPETQKPDLPSTDRIKPPLPPGTVGGNTASLNDSDTQDSNDREPEPGKKIPLTRIFKKKRSQK